VYSHVCNLFIPNTRLMIVGICGGLLTLYVPSFLCVNIPFILMFPIFTFPMFAPQLVLFLFFLFVYYLYFFLLRLDVLSACSRSRVSLVQWCGVSYSGSGSGGRRMRSGSVYRVWG
jgi:hypothetical protein